MWINELVGLGIYNGNKNVDIGTLSGESNCSVWMSDKILIPAPSAGPDLRNVVMHRDLRKELVVRFHFISKKSQVSPYFCVVFIFFANLPCCLFFRILSNASSVAVFLISVYTGCSRLNF